MRAATYARYSSGRQRDTSIDDQIRNCDRAAERQGLEIVARYEDRAISGADNTRPGYLRMLADAEARCFDVLLIDDLSRLARDIVDQTNALRYLDFWGVRVLGVSEGFDTDSEFADVQAGVQGTFNERYRKELAKKTHRGLEGQVLRGGVASSAPYGYRIVAGENVQRLEINEDQAKWVRWIFEQRAAGRGPRKIAYELNRLGVPSPRGSTWAASALSGSREHGTGLLNSKIYIGQYVWNRSRWIHNPVTKKRTRRMRPQSEWVRNEHPELRIVPQELWEAAQAQMRRQKGQVGRKATALFSGILRCGHCGSSMVVVNGKKYGCVTAKERGPSVCKGIYLPRLQVDTILLSHVREDLLSPHRVAKIREYVAALLREISKSTENLKPRLQALELEIGNLVDAMAKTGHSEAICKRLQSAEIEQKALQVKIKVQEERLEIPDVVSRYKAAVMDLQAALASDIDRAKAIMASLFGQIKVEQAGEEVYAEIQTRPEQLLAAGNGEYLMMVAGAGFEPTTFGL